MAANQGVDKVLNSYRKRRDMFEIKRDSIIAELYKKYPELQKLRREYAALRINMRKTENAKDTEIQYVNIREKYNNMLQHCLKNEGIAPETIQYAPECPLCNDSGFVGDGKKKFCTCVINKAAQLVLESSHINSQQTFGNSNFGVFDDANSVYSNSTQKRLMQKLYDYLLSWTTSFPENEKKQLLFIGNVGLGKSYMLNAIAYEIITKGYSAMLISSFAINEAAFDEIKKSDSSALNMARSMDLLLIDDLGGEPVLDKITCPTLLNILNERTRKNLSTVISTNLNYDMLEKRYGSRVVSRLFDKARTFIPPILGTDIRKK